MVSSGREVNRGGSIIDKEVCSAQGKLIYRERGTKGREIVAGTVKIHAARCITWIELAKLFRGS